MKYNIGIALSIFLICLLLISCEKDQDIKLPQAGSIDFRIVGQYSGYNLNLSDAFSLFSDYTESKISENEDGLKTIKIKRYSNDLISYITIQLTLDSLNNKVEFELDGVYFHFEIKNADNTIITLDNTFTYGGWEMPANQRVIVNEINKINYNKANKSISGDFEYFSSKIPNVNEDEITVKGNFDVQLYEYIY